MMKHCQSQINQSTHPPKKGGKQGTKWKGLGFDVSSFEGEPTKYYWQPKHSHILAIGCTVK
jgi:hypothetical protein